MYGPTDYDRAIYDAINAGRAADRKLYGMEFTDDPSDFKDYKQYIKDETEHGKMPYQEFVAELKKGCYSDTDVYKLATAFYTSKHPLQYILDLLYALQLSEYQQTADCHVRFVHKMCKKYKKKLMFSTAD
jgi:hypothetical protein